MTLKELFQYALLQESQQLEETYAETAPLEFKSLM